MTRIEQVRAMQVEMWGRELWSDGEGRGLVGGRAGQGSSTVNIIEIRVAKQTHPLPILPYHTSNTYHIISYK